MKSSSTWYLSGTISPTNFSIPALMTSAITDLAIKQWVQMDLKEFAQKHSLQIRRSRQDDTGNIGGRSGEIYQYDDSELALILCGGPTWAVVPRPK
jgi:hypothetical protein